MRYRTLRRTAPALAASATLALAAHAAIAAAPAAETSAAGSGKVTLIVAGGKAAKALGGAGAKVGATSPAKRRGKRVILPVGKVAVGKSASVAARGGIRFTAGGRTVVLRSVRLTLTAKRATVTAKAGKRRLAILTAAATKRGGKAKLDGAADAARLAGARLALTPRAAKLLRARLAAPGIRAGVLGKLGVDARPAPDGNPRSGELGPEPPRKVRPASAVDVSGISIVWYPRDSWVRYVTSGVGRDDGLSASGGATKLPPIETPAHPCSDVSYSGSGSFDYGHRFAGESGWYDPVTGAAAVYGRGTVRFLWKSHGIDLRAANPEIELDGTGSRAIFAFTGKGSTPFTDERADLVALDLAGQPSVSGNARTYTALRGRLTANGQSVFAGFYPPPNDRFGCVSVSFTAP